VVGNTDGTLENMADRCVLRFGEDARANIEAGGRNRRHVGSSRQLSHRAQLAHLLRYRRVKSGQLKWQIELADAIVQVNWKILSWQIVHNACGIRSGSSRAMQNGKTAYIHVYMYLVCVRCDVMC